MAKRPSPQPDKPAGLSASSAARRDKAEAARKQASKKNRTASFAIVGTAVLLGVLIIGFAVFSVLRESERNSRDLDVIGASAADAGCNDVVTKPATGNAVHEATGTDIPYLDAPPASGPHWGEFLQGNEIKKLYTADDRPPVERIVHSLEHGYTVLWYDETIANDDAAMAEIRSVAKKFPSFSDLNDRLMIAPWTSDDGSPFEDGKHVALTHWSVTGETTGGDSEANGQLSVWQYCAEVSGEAIGEFMAEYPATDAPEPGAI